MTKVAAKIKKKNSLQLSTKLIKGPCQLTSRGFFYWVKLSLKDWILKDDGERESIKHELNSLWVDLIGHEVKLRVTGQPFDTSSWAAQMDSTRLNTGNSELEDSWLEYLDQTQDVINGKDPSSAAVYIGVRITESEIDEDKLNKILGFGERNKKDDALRETFLKVKRSLLSESKTKEVNHKELCWLMHASISLGIPISDNDLPKDNGQPLKHYQVDSFTDPVSITSQPISNYFEVTAARSGTLHTKYVSVISADILEERDEDYEDVGSFPWIAFSRSLRFPVEFVFTFQVLSKEDIRPNAEYNIRRIRNIINDYNSADDGGNIEVEDNPLIPDHIKTAYIDGKQVLAEVDKKKNDAVGTRLRGLVRVAVTADNKATLVDRVSEFKTEYRKKFEDRWTETVLGQQVYAREFVPGEGVAQDGGYVTTMPCRYLSAGVPNMSGSVGSPSGPYLGFPIDFGQEPTFWNPQHGPQINRSGVCPLIGVQGAGKTATAGKIAHDELLLGHQVVIGDPAGMTHLEYLPYLKKVIRRVEVSSMENGSLNPGFLISDPPRKDFNNEVAYQKALNNVVAERSDLFIDTFLSILPYDLLARNLGASAIIENVVTTIVPHYGIDPWLYVAEFEKGSGVSQDIAKILRTASMLRGGSLIFPDRNKESSFDFDSLGTILSTKGLDIPPPELKREDWNRYQRASAPIQNLISRFATRIVQNDQAPKLIFMDEIGSSATGKNALARFISNVSAMSRKHNLGFGIISHNSTQIANLDDEFLSHIGACLIGRITDPTSQLAAMKLLGLDLSKNYHTALGGLQAGQFIVKDFEGRLGLRQVDFSAYPHLLEVLDTTPEADQAIPEKVAPITVIGE